MSRWIDEADQLDHNERIEWTEGLKTAARRAIAGGARTHSVYACLHRRSGIVDLNLKRLGGSDMAAVMGLSPYDSPFVPYERIVHGVERARTPEQLERMEWGRILEPVIAAAYCMKLQRPAMKGASIDHPKREWQRYTLDYYWPDLRELLEIKALGERMFEGFGEPGTDQIPDDKMIQVQTYLEATGFPRARLVALFGGQHMREYVIERDERLGALIVEAGERFWRDHIVPQVPPPLDGSEDARGFLMRRYAASARGQIRTPATEREDAIALKLRGVGTALRELEQERDRLRNELRASIANDRGIQGYWGRAVITAGDKPALRVEFQGVENDRAA